jgi:type II restriction enzyme
MENLVESHLQKVGLVKDSTYFKEMKTGEIEEKWGVDLSAMTNQGETVKKFDFVVKTNKNIYGIETNFYTGKGSKLSETARSYKNIAVESKAISNFFFVWVTDGQGWHTARKNLKETFDVMEHIYNIGDLENGAMSRIFN